MNTLSIDAKKTLPIAEAVELALGTIHEFGFLLIKETEALKEADKDAVSSLQSDKVKLANEYQEWIVTLNERKEEARTLPKEFKERLNDAYKNFAKITDENARTLIYKKQATERILKLFISAAKKSVPDSPNYNSDGFYGIKKDIPISFKVNQTL